MKNNLAFEVFYLVLQIFGIFTISFILLHLVPGDPILVMLGESSTISDRVALRESLGLDQPLFQQLYHQLSN